MSYALENQRDWRTSHDWVLDRLDAVPPDGLSVPDGYSADGLGNLLAHNELVLPQSGSEPRFEPELLRTGPKFGSKSSVRPEPNAWFGPWFAQVSIFLNLFEPMHPRLFRGGLLRSVGRVRESFLVIRMSVLSICDN